MKPMPSTNTYHVAVVGATGAVGTELLNLLKLRKFPLKELTLFASDRSKGCLVDWKEKQLVCQSLREGCFSGVDLVFFDASDEVSEKWVPHAADTGAWVIDNSAVFRLNEDVPLIVPEVNGEFFIQWVKEQVLTSPWRSRKRIIAGPNCSTVQLTLVLKPIAVRWGLTRVVVSTYQSVSGAGQEALQALLTQTQVYLKSSVKDKTLGNKKDEIGGAVECAPFLYPIRFNCIPHIGPFNDFGESSEEQKIVQESRKLLNLPDLKITVSAVRVPTLLGHGETVNIECENPLALDELRAYLSDQPGLEVKDNPQDGWYPLAEGPPHLQAVGRDEVFVGRIRRDLSVKSGVNLWIVADNLRKGAALNAIQIGELLLQTLSHLSVSGVSGV